MSNFVPVTPSVDRWVPPWLALGGSWHPASACPDWLLLRLHQDKHRRHCHHTKPTLTVSHRTHPYLTVFNHTSPYMQNRRTSSSPDQWLKPLTRRRGGCAWRHAHLIHTSSGSHRGNVSPTISPDECTHWPTHEYPRPSGYRHGQSTEGEAPTVRYRWGCPSLNDQD